MTCQGKRKPKTEFLCRITNENYDFLYRVARVQDASLAAVLNRILADARESGINLCISTNPHTNMREANYAR